MSGAQIFHRREYDVQSEIDQVDAGDRQRRLASHDDPAVEETVG
jgi:hypothetical protein